MEKLTRAGAYLGCYTHWLPPIGITANKLLVETASNREKPDGLTLIAEAGKVAFLRPLAGSFAGLIGLLPKTHGV